MAEESAKVPDTVEVTKDVLAPADGPRENLISTAVKFLQNPKVQQSPLYQKKAFLEKKGLTKEEIDIAVQKSGVGEGTQVAPPPQAQHPLGPFQQAPVVLPPPAPLPTTWSRVRDFTTTAVVITSISYAVYRLYQLYIRPWLLGKAASDDSRMQRIEKKLEELESLNETMRSVENTLKSIHESLTAQQASLAVLSQRSIHGPLDTQLKSTESSLLQEVKSEVSSLKGLLLSRRQFPPVPQTSPVLPSWQLTTSSTTVTSSDSSESQSNGTESSPSSDNQAAASSQPEDTQRLGGGDNSSSSQGQISVDSDSVSATESASLHQTSELEVKDHEPHSEDGDSNRVKDTSEDNHSEMQAVSASS